MKWVWVVLFGLLLVACQSGDNNVSQLKTQAAPGVEATKDVDAASSTDEEKMMAFTQCMRDEDIELMDVSVDAEGNAQRSTLAEGAQFTPEEYGEAMAVCGTSISKA